MASTPRFALPFIAPGQAQKELYHNEALQTLDMVAMPAVEEGPRDSPPVNPSLGACYIVGPSPTGAWAGEAHHLTGWTSGGWRFVAPAEGMTAYVRAASLPAVFRSGAWDVGAVRATALVIGGEQVVGPQAAAISSPSGGTTVDAEARATVVQILAALRQHGLIQP
jgi:hypothetical protein